MGRIERAPAWILKYRDRIERGAVTVEEILEEENRVRDKPIKLSTVTRAINALGFQTSGLHRAEESETSPSPAGSETAVAVNEEKKGSGPGWLQKYRERIENGTITVEEILEEENRIRDKPIKLSTVTRAINAMGFHTSGLHRSAKAESEFKTVTAAEAETGEEEKKGSGPGWLQKYRERIENGTITVEEILEEENRIRDKPIKLSTVTRAINAMGFHTSGLHRSAKAESEFKTVTAAEAETGEEEKKGSGPGWLQKYRERIENGTITVEEILEEENRIRDKPIKLSTVTRAINAMGFQTSGLRRGTKKTKTAVEEEVVEEEATPYWILKYRNRIENGTITMEEILEEENRIRDKPIKLSTLARALNIIGSARKKEEKLEMESEIRTRERTDFQSSIGEITEATKKRFDAIKGDWERDLGRTLHNDYFMNILLALAKLLGYGKTLAMKK